MKFLVDAQLPLRLARLLQSAGYDTIHTFEFFGARLQETVKVTTGDFMPGLNPHGNTISQAFKYGSQGDIVTYEDVLVVR